MGEEAIVGRPRVGSHLEFKLSIDLGWLSSSFGVARASTVLGRCPFFKTARADSLSSFFAKLRADARLLAVHILLHGLRRSECC